MSEGHHARGGGRWTGTIADLGRRGIMKSTADQSSKVAFPTSGSITAVLAVAVMLISACGDSEGPVGGLSTATTRQSQEAGTTIESDPPATTSSTTTTSTTFDPEASLVEAVCTDFTTLLDENPDLRVGEAESFSISMRETLEDNGWDTALIGRRIVDECNNGYNNDAIMGYGGWGPLADLVTYTLDRGSCSSRGDYGGVLEVSGFGSTYSVALELTYIADGVVEHSTTERIDVEAGGNAVAFEFFMPSLPAGGTCEVELVSVAPDS